MLVAIWAATMASRDTCGDTLLNNTGLGSGGTVSALLNVSAVGECCDQCHTNYHDECVGWTYGGTPQDAAIPPHNCAIFSRITRPSPVNNHISAVVGGVKPSPPPPGPPGSPCRADLDCNPDTAVQWRCLVDKGQPPSPANNCHLPGPGTAGNSTCACSSVTCAITKDSTNKTAIQYLMIGDSISMGMQNDLSQIVSAHNWELTHNPGNAASSNLGAHCVSDWTQPGSRKKWDVLSYNFGLHDLGYDTERINVEQYTALLQNITEAIASLQKSGLVNRVIWVTSTPVPTVPVYGPSCNKTATCLNPPRFNSDVVLYNQAAAQVVQAANSAGAKIETADLYDFVLKKCGGAGYAHCDGFQLPANVHYTPEGWSALAVEMSGYLLNQTDH